MKVLKTFLRSKIFIGIIAVTVVGFSGYKYFTRSNGSNIETATVSRRDIVQRVSATGNVKPAKSVDLAFSTGGKIARVYVAVGTRVSAGQALAALDASELNAQLAKAQADLEGQGADIAKAEVDLVNRYANIRDTLNSDYTAANDAIRIKADLLFTNSDTSAPQLAFSPIDSQKKTDAEYQRLLMGNMLTKWIGEINALGQSPSPAELEGSLKGAAIGLGNAENFLDLLNDAVVNAPSLGTSAMNSYKTNISSARTEIDTALSDVNTLLQNIASQKAVIAADQASQKSYQAAIDEVKAKLANAVISSPIAGVVTKADAKVGQIAAANQTVVSVISDSNLEIESNIPEVDIAKVKVGDKADVTLDAYGNGVLFKTVVSSIDPAEIVVEGVATYLTKFQFLQYDARVKSGMTANIDIVSAEHKNALSLPQKAVKKNGTREYVLFSTGSKEHPSEERDIKTGIRSYDGYVEILDGLAEGDKVIISTAK